MSASDWQRRDGGRRASVLILWVVWTACGGGGGSSAADAPAPSDAAALDGRPADAAQSDAIIVDAIPLDATPGDAIIVDAAALDAVPLDAPPLDAPPLDASPDAAVVTCGPGNCAGCCEGNTCVTGDTAVACGAGGRSCTTCGTAQACNVISECADLADPCQGISPAGVCSTASSISYCAVLSGDGGAGLAAVACQQGDTCQVVGGEAQCVLTAACRNGDTQCVGTGQIRTCEAGAWVTSACPRDCIGSPLGDFCSLNVSTKVVTGSLRYDVRGPNGAPPTDWSAPAPVEAQGFLVLSLRYDASGNSELVDSTLTTVGGATPGAFSVRVPAVPQPLDYLIFMAVGTDPDPVSGQPRLAFMVADPGLAADSTYPPGQVGAEPASWSWSAEVGGFVSGSTLTISETSFSGAARVFDYARYVYALGKQRFPGFHPFIMWMAPGVDWSCGKCAGSGLHLAFDTLFSSQIWLGGSAQDQPYWSDAVTTHELGHRTMYNHYRYAAEGGFHVTGVAYPPGMAWSEGYATWFSSDVRDDPVYVDKQNGTMFWLDIDQRVYGSGAIWGRPLAGLGLDQLIDENEVATMLRDLSYWLGLGHGPLDAALVSPRMTQPRETAPAFERGYTWHRWETTPTGQPINILDTGVPIVHLADFLDQLRCSGVSAAIIDAVTEPTVHYPYPSGAPLCRP